MSPAPATSIWAKPTRNSIASNSSRNSTTLLLLLDQLGLLKFHRVEQTVSRGMFLDGRWPHATAVITDLKTNMEWAVDSWTHPAGEKPDVKPLKIWLQEN